jgi:hypothetical protein
MNDRASNRPPSVYTRNKDSPEQYFANQEMGSVTPSGTTQIPYDTGNEQPKPSGIFRFGKSVANALNPSVVWQGLTGFLKDKRDHYPLTDNLQQSERKLKTEKEYLDFKNLGFPGMRSASHVHLSFAPQYGEEPAHLIDNSRDSGVELDDRSSGEQKRLDSDGDLEGLVPPTIGRERSASIVSTGRVPRSPRRLTKPSLNSLRTVKSRLRLPSSKPRTDSPSASVLSLHAGLAKKQSHKDLQIQEKLKKIGHLESELEKERQDLRRISDDAPPVPVLSKEKRRNFGPGRLASLPSERILHDEAAREALAKEAGRDTSRVAGASRQPAANLQPSIEVELTQPISTSSKSEAGNAAKRASVHPSFTKKVISKKGKCENLGDLQCQPAPTGDADARSEEQNPSAKKPPGAPSKKYKGKKTEATGSLAFKPRTEELKHVMDEARCQTDMIKHGDDQTLRLTRSVAAEPNRIAVFDPKNVDTAKLLKMRSTKCNAPFGKLSDDVLSLRKEYPTITNDEIISFVNEGRENKQILSKVDLPLGPPSPIKAKTSFMSLAHHDQAEPALLGRPTLFAAAEKIPARTLGKQPPSLDQVKRIDARGPTLRSSSRRGGVDAITVSPAKDRSVPPVPLVPAEMAGERFKAIVDSKDEGETFVWDDDVF